MKIQKDIGIEDKQRKENCSQNTLWKKINRTGERILLSREYDNGEWIKKAERSGPIVRGVYV